jgi:D-alanine transaminase
MLVHLNGQLLPRSQARIDPFDRGFIFGEGVYEGLRSIPWHDSTRMIGLAAHIRRMQRGLDAAGIRLDISTLGQRSAELVKANNLRDAFVYWQITGGTPGEGDPVRSRPRGKNTLPTIFGYCTPQPPLEAQHEPATKRVVTRRDIRWELGWLKSISLMGNVMLAMQADAAGAEEAILIREGLITEGLATNILIAKPDESGETELVTPALESAPMLAGVTRDLLLRLDPSIRQRAVQAEELSQASEVMLLGTTTMVTSITEIDGRRVGSGAPGPQARRLLALLTRAIQTERDVE